MTLLAIARPDGGLSLMRLLDDADPEAELAKWQTVHPDGYLGYHIIGEADVPEDRIFRNAWVMDGKTIGCDMDKAREIHRDAMRAARTPKLAALDIAYQRADEAKDDAAKAVIAAQKQELRDVTADPRIDAAQTPAELKAVWPEVLGVTTPSR